MKNLGITREVQHDDFMHTIIKFCLQTHPGEIAGLVPDHFNKVNHDLFAGGKSCF